VIRPSFNSDRGNLAQVGYVQNGRKIPINTGTTRYRSYLVLDHAAARRGTTACR